MFLNAKHTAAVCFATCMSLSASAIADIVISGTRVIYKSNEKALMFGWKIRGIIRYSFRAGWILATIVLNQGVLLSHLPPPLLFRELMPNVVKLLN